MKAVCLAGLVALSALGAPEARAPKAFKGMELYSWKDAKRGWLFALLPGTNRLKSEREVKASPHPLAGPRAVSRRLKTLAEGEEIFWASRGTGFAYPDATTVGELKAAAAAAKVRLELPDTGPAPPARAP